MSVCLSTSHKIVWTMKLDLVVLEICTTFVFTNPKSVFCLYNVLVYVVRSEFLITTLLKVQVFFFCQSALFGENIATFRRIVWPSRPALGPTQPPVQWVSGLFSGGKAAGA